jgi:hypothetical protein
LIILEEQEHATERAIITFTNRHIRDATVVTTVRDIGLSMRGIN